MSVIFMDSFAHYASADIDKKWTTNSNGTIVAASGRRAGNALYLNTNQWVSRNFSASYSDIIVGVAVKGSSLAAGAHKMFYFTEGGIVQFDLVYQSDGVIRAYRGDSSLGNLLGSSAPGALPIDAWAYVEASLVVDNAAGSIVVKVNGTTVLSLTGVDTQQTASAYVTAMRLIAGPNNRLYFNDLYVIDPGTAPNTTFLGDVRVDAYYPTADGASSQWAPTPSGAHYATVDETAPSGTDYIAADVAGYIDLFAGQDLAVDPGAGGFFAVQVCAAAIKTDAGSRQLKTLVRRSSTNYAGTAKDVSETEKYITNQWDTDPSTAAAWTKAGFDAAEFGVELV